MSYKKRKGFAALTIILLLLLYIRLSANTTETYTYKTVYVESGMTLWGIAEKYNNTDLEIRDYIEVVCEKNHTNGMLQIGQELIIPVKE